MEDSKKTTLKEQDTIKKATSSRQPSMRSPINNEKDLIRLIETYLNNITKEGDNEQLELEVKFGTLGSKKITKIGYDNIIKKLVSSGFVVDTNEYLMRIQSEYTDLKTNKIRMSTIRTEINGLHNIRKYCQTNRIDTIDNGVSFIQKSRFNNKQSNRDNGNGNDMSSVDVRDLNYRVSLSKEYTMNIESPIIRSTIDKWNDNKKTFRYLNRFKLRHPNFPVVVDMSIVKESKKQDNRFYIPEYNIHDSGVFTSQKNMK